MLSWLLFASQGTHAALFLLALHADEEEG